MSARARVPALSYFFPAHNEEANLRGLVEEALATLPGPRRGLRDRSSSTTARATRRRRSPTSSPPPTRASGSSTIRATSATERLCGPGLPRRGYELLAFTDGDRQFRVVDLGRLTGAAAEGDADAVVGYRIKRADPLVRTSMPAPTASPTGSSSASG